VAPEGESVLGTSLGTFAGQESGLNETPVLGTLYGLERGPGGWAVEPLAPPPSFKMVTPVDASSDLGQVLYVLSGDAPQTEPPSYYLRQADGELVSIGPASYLTPPPNTGFYVYVQGAAGDLSRIVTQMPAGDPWSLWPGDMTLQGVGGRHSLYEYEGIGNPEPHLVGVSNQYRLASNTEAQLISQCGTQLGYSRFPGPSAEEAYNAVSATGFAVFFTAWPGGCEGQGGEVGAGPPVAELYARVEGSRTFDISEPPLDIPGRDCTGTCRETQEEEGGLTRSEGEFAGASADGHRVFFITSQPLVDQDTDSTADLYMEELGPSGVTRLVDISAGAAGDPTPGSGALIQGVSRVSQDGSMVYFVAKGLLTAAPNANGESAEAGADNLYGYDVATNVTSFVVRLSTKDTKDWRTFDLRPVQASEDGRFLAFWSRAQPAGSGTTSTAGQLYEYDASDRSLVRVSIGQHGTYVCPQTGKLEEGYNCDGNVEAAAQAAKLPQPSYLESRSTLLNNNLAITGEGSVFFESRNALTPQAVNGYPNLDPGLENIYEYRDGNVYLITPGNEQAVTDESGTLSTRMNFVGIAADGRDVFFQSAAQLVPQATSSERFDYDARVDGGFPGPASITGCQGDGCRGSSTMAGTTLAAGTTHQTGAGNVLRHKHKKRRHRKHRHHRHSHRGHRHKSKGRDDTGHPARSGRGHGKPGRDGQVREYTGGKGE
jgi:hypothetical protein